MKSFDKPESYAPSGIIMGLTFPGKNASRPTSCLCVAEYAKHASWPTRIMKHVEQRVKVYSFNSTGYMNTNIYSLLTPIALGFILIEMALCWFYRKQFISFQEAVANFG